MFDVGPSARLDILSFISVFDDLVILYSTLDSGNWCGQGSGSS